MTAWSWRDGFCVLALSAPDGGVDDALAAATDRWTERASDRFVVRKAVHEVLNRILVGSGQRVGGNLDPALRTAR